MVAEGIRRLLSIAGIVALAVMLVIPNVAAGQAGGSKALVTGVTITWTADWTLEPEIGTADANFELLVLSRGASLVAAGGTSFAASSAEMRDLVIEAFAGEGTLQQIDRGDYDNVSYSIDLSTSGTTSIAIFTLVIENPNATSLYVLISDPPAFQGAMESAQSAVTIDGAPIFDGVDAAVMEQTINAAAPAAPAAATTPAAPAPAATTPAAPPASNTPAAPPAQPTQAGEGDVAGGLNVAIGSAGDQATTPTAPAQATTPAAPAQATTPAASAPLPNAAVVASSGTEVRFSNDWSIQSEAESSVSIGAQGPPTVLVTVIDLGAVPGAVDARTLADALIAQLPDLADAEVRTAVNTPDGRVVIVMLDPSDQGNLYRLYEVKPDAAATTAVSVIVAEADLQPAMDLIGTTVTLNGQPVLTDLPQLAPELFPAG